MQPRVEFYMGELSLLIYLHQDDLAGWRIVWHDDGEGVDMGATDFDAQTISLRRGMAREEIRSTLVHEIMHVLDGPSGDERCEARDELTVRKATARWLLPTLRPVGEALAWSQLRVREAAKELHVDAGVLWDRLDHLHPLENGYLARRLQDLGEA